MVPIELDDEVPDGAPPRGPGRRRSRLWVVVGGAVAALALAAGQWAADRAQASSWDRLSDRADVVVPLGGSLAVRWSLDPSQLMAVAQGVGWRGTVVGPVALPDGSVAVTALDDRDGHRRWTTPVIGPDAQRAALGGTWHASGSCRRVPDDASRVVCLVSDAVVVDSGTSVTTRNVTSQVHLVAVDPRTGQLQADHRIGADLDTLDALLPGGLVVVVSSRSSSAHPGVVGVDLDTGTERWRTAPPALAQWSGFGAAAVGNAVAVIGGSGLDVLGPDGSVRRSVRLNGYQGYLSLPDGRIVVPEADGTLVVGPDRDVHLDGSPMWLAADDGSVPGLTLIRNGTLHAYDADGHQRWELPGPAPSGAVVLRGVLYATRDGGVVAVDGSTGTVRWQTALAVQQRSPVTDGRVLLVALGSDVAALDLRTGAVAWRSPLPVDHPELGAFGGMLLAGATDGSSTLVLG
ncbi:MAG: hypothetical protein B7X41_03710 [Microbacterium sp. 14-71-5]|jgi:outer membrane protein assembly factor BamB|nr:MAG: hypothetical protein B7X41_03710 [Microbacterium sp. 14-71-5]